MARKKGAYKKRSIQKTVRMIPEVYDYVCRMRTGNFTDNFESMVLFCMTREKYLHEEVKKLESQKNALQTEIKKYEDMYSDLDQLKQYIQTFLSKR